MKKLVAVAEDTVEVVEVPMPEMQEDEVLIRTVRSLISPGSELKRVRRSAAGSNRWPNHDLGYAAAGVVEEAGAQVSDFKPGDRVVTMMNHQEYVTSKASLTDSFPALPLPESIDWDLAPFCIWGRSCINWCQRANVQLDENVAIVGCGLVGLLMTMFTRLQNPKSLIAVDLVPERRDLALRCGADHVVGGEEAPVEEALKLTAGGADVTLHCVGGAAVKSFETSQRITRSGGRAILIGHHMEALTVLPGQFTGKDLLGANVGYDYSPTLFLDGIRLIEQGKLPMKETITHSVPYTDGPAIYDMLIKNPGPSAGILFKWD